MVYWFSTWMLLKKPIKSSPYVIKDDNEFNNSKLNWKYYKCQWI